MLTKSFVLLYLFSANRFEDEHSIQAVQSRILRATQMPFETGVGSFNVDASVGYSIFPDHGDTVDTLINFADKSMYAKKHASG